MRKLRVVTPAASNQGGVADETSRAPLARATRSCETGRGQVKSAPLVAFQGGLHDQFTATTDATGPHLETGYDRGPRQISRRCLSPSAAPYISALSTSDYPRQTTRRGPASLAEQMRRAPDGSQAPVTARDWVPAATC